MSGIHFIRTLPLKGDTTGFLDLSWFFLTYCLFNSYLQIYPTHNGHSSLLYAEFIELGCLREFCVVSFDQIRVRFHPVMIFVLHVYKSNVGSFCKARMG